MTEANPSPLRIDALRKQFPRRAGRSARAWALDGVSLSVGRGEIVALVGESGSGKSTLGRIVVGVEEPTSGTVAVDGADVRRSGRHRRSRAQMIFQDPVSSLNPRWRIGQSVAEAVPSRDRVVVRSRVVESLERVGLSERTAGRYPAELSGGQCQRVGIARAIASAPSVLVADEPTSALDVSVQATVVNVLVDLVRSERLALLFITHDLALAHNIADRIAVLRDGVLVESGDAESVMRDPRHPYTRELIDGATRLAPRPVRD